MLKATIQYTIEEVEKIIREHIYAEHKLNIVLDHRRYNAEDQMSAEFKWYDDGVMITCTPSYEAPQAKQGDAFQIEPIERE